MLRSLRDSALSTADQVLLTVTPTTGDELLEAPACYLPLLKSTLSALASDRTWVLSKDSHALGLDVPDFVFAENPEQPDSLRLDFAHLNIFGARKYASSIAAELRAHGYTGESAR